MWHVPQYTLVMVEGTHLQFHLHQLTFANPSSVSHYYTCPTCSYPSPFLSYLSFPLPMQHHATSFSPSSSFTSSFLLASVPHTTSPNSLLPLPLPYCSHPKSHHSLPPPFSTPHQLPPPSPSSCFYPIVPTLPLTTPPHLPFPPSCQQRLHI